MSDCNYSPTSHRFYASLSQEQSTIDNDQYIQQLEQKIAKQQELICKQEQTIKQLSNTYSEFVTILTRLWNKSFNIDIIKTREEIKEILKIWYEKEWLDVL